MRWLPRNRAALGRLVALVVVVVVSVTVPAVRSSAASTISARVRYDTITLGQTVGVIGTTSPAAPGTTVVIERRIITTWSARAIGTTDAAGAFAVPITPGQSGIYALRVRTATGTSTVFYLRILGPLTLDPGGLGTLRLGMTLAQAKATHWVIDAESCGGSFCGDRAVFPAAVHASAVFRQGKLAEVAVGYGGATVEGLRVGDQVSRILAVYRPPTWSITFPGPGGPAILTVAISQGWRTVYRIYLPADATSTTRLNSITLLR